MTRLVDLDKVQKARPEDIALAPITNYYEAQQLARQLQSEVLAQMLGTAWRAIARLTRQLVGNSLLRVLRQRRTVSELNQLDNRLLADIGLDRGEIETVAEQLAAKAYPSTPLRLPLAGTLSLAWKRHAAIRELRRLPDYVLNDIGVPRAEIVPTVVRLMAKTAEAPEAQDAHPVHDMLGKVGAAGLRATAGHREAAALPGDFVEKLNRLAKRNGQAQAANENSRQVGAA